MAATHLPIDDQKPHGRMVRQITNAVDTILTLGPELVNTLQRMIGPGDGSSDTDYTEMAFRLGTVATLDGALTAAQVARAAYEELAADIGKLTTDAEQPNVFTALSQLTNKLR